MSFIPKTITKLEKRGLLLKNYVDIINEFKTKLAEIPGNKGNIIQEKSKFVLENNVGYTKLENIQKALEQTVTTDVDINIISSYKYASPTSVEVERAFSLYKKILTNRRHNFTDDNLESHVCLNFNYNKNSYTNMELL